jgi:pimeloyl-ACP methyl ester carboxylesterase
MGIWYNARGRRKPVIAHDAESEVRKIEASTQMTFGRNDMVTSTRFADPLKQNIQHAEVVIFEGCAHAPVYEKVDEFNQTTLEFLKRHSG